MTRPAVALLRLWLAGTGVVLLCLAVWAFAPVLLFLLLLAAALGLLSALMIWIARALEARCARHDS